MVNLRLSAFKLYPGANIQRRPIRFLKPEFYRKNYVVLPICALVVIDICWVTFCTIKGFTRTDVVLSRNWIKSRPESEMTELLINPVSRKFYKVIKYPPNQELYNAYEAMKKAEGKC